MSAHRLPDDPSTASMEPAKRQSPQTLIADTNDNDVLFGRGNHVNKSLGNIRFRRLIRENKEDYSISRKHYEKDVLARKVCNAVLRRGGRFLRKVTNHSKEGKILWEIVGAIAAVSKIKQAFRDNSFLVTDQSHARIIPVKSVFRRKRKVDSTSKKRETRQQCASSDGTSVLPNLASSAFNRRTYHTIEDQQATLSTQLNLPIDSSCPSVFQNSKLLVYPAGHDTVNQDTTWMMRDTSPFAVIPLTGNPQVTISTQDFNTHENQRAYVSYKHSFAPCYLPVNHGVDNTQVNQSVPLHGASTDIGQHRFMLDQMSEQWQSTIAQHDSLCLPNIAPLQTYPAEETSETFMERTKAPPKNLDDGTSIHTSSVGRKHEIDTASFQNLSNFHMVSTLPRSEGTSLGGRNQQHQMLSNCPHQRVEHDLASLRSHQRTLLATDTTSRNQQQSPPNGFPASAQKRDPPGLHDAILGIHLANRTFEQHRQCWQQGKLSHNNESLEPTPVLIDRVGLELSVQPASASQGEYGNSPSGFDAQSGIIEQPPHLFNDSQHHQYGTSTQSTFDHDIVRPMSPRPFCGELKGSSDAPSLPSRPAWQEKESVTSMPHHSSEVFEKSFGQQPHWGHNDK